MTTLVERSQEVVDRFLQTVVLIDDEAHFRNTSAANSEEGARPGAAQAEAAPAEAPPAAGAEPRALQPANESPLSLTPPTQAQIQAATEERVDSHDLDAKQVTDGFARRGLVCAVLKPGAEESGGLAQMPAVQRADIVVLDWVFHNDYGNVTLGMIAGLLDADPDRLRLIAVYTGQNDLVRIADRIAELIGPRQQSSPLERPNPFTVCCGPVRVAVFAKPKTRIPAEDAEAVARITTSADLAGVLVGEFASMTVGLVSNVAVASLAALRRNTHRILRRLSPSLDAGYLWHRATQVYPQDAEEHLKVIVVDELAAILSDENVQSYAGIEAIEAWLEVRVPEDNYRTRFDLQADASRADVIQLLTNGVAGKANEAIKQRFTTLGKKPHTRNDQCFAESAGACITANESFAMLLSLRSRYQSPTPTLTLGSLLKRNTEGSETYWVCVQPACDCLRLKVKTPFPMLPFSVASAGEPFHIVLGRGAGTVRLKLLSKPLNLRLETFLPSDTARGVVAAERDDGGWFFKSESGDRYDWLAELKPEHGLWVANQLSAQMRRVGLIESEWLRRWYSSSDN